MLVESTFSSLHISKQIVLLPNIVFIEQMRPEVLSTDESLLKMGLAFLDVKKQRY